MQIEFTKEEYLSVLKNEIETLKMYYGGEQYSVALNVLEERYNTIKDSLITTRMFCQLPIS